MFDFFDVRSILLMIFPVLLALTVHEYAHALAARRLGDYTATDQGRLTLNPIAHLDPLGTLMLFFSGLVGWAKPVPINPANFKNPMRDMTLVALAGPISNFLTAVVLAFFINITFFLGLWGLLPGSVGQDLIYIFHLAIFINIALGIFNLLPFPPLDGFKVISYFLPLKWVFFAERYQLVFLGLFLVLVLTGQIQKFIYPVIVSLFNLIIIS